MRITEDGKEVRVLGIHGSLKKVEQAKQILRRLTDLYTLKKFPEVIDNELSNDLWNSCSISSTTLSSAFNVNKLTQHENFDSQNKACNDDFIDLNPQSLKSNGSNNEIRRLATRFSEINDSFNSEFKRLNKDFYETMLKVSFEFYANLERQNQRNKNGIDMDYSMNKNLLTEITEFVSIISILDNLLQLK